MEKKFKDIRGNKSGTDYIVLKIPKKDLKEIPDLFYIDFEIKDIRDGRPSKKSIIRRKR